MQSELALGPESIDRVLVIDLLIKIGQPADVILGPIDLQLRQTIENTGNDQLTRFDGTRVVRSLAREALHEVGRRPLLALRLARIFKEPRLARPDFGWKRRVHDRRHCKIDRSGPKTIVIRRRKTLAARKSAEPHGFESHAFAPFHLSYVFLDTDVGQHGDADETVAIDGAILFGEVIVEALDDRHESALVADR